MKKIYLIFLLGAIPASSQSTLGVKGGLNLSKIPGTLWEYGSSWRQGYQLGLEANVPITKWVYMNSTAMFVQKGGDITANWLKGEINANYLESTMNIGIPIVTISKRKFALLLGGYGALGIGGRSELNLGTITYDRSTEFGVRTGRDYESFKKYDAGILGGIVISKESRSITLEYVYGLYQIHPAHSSFRYEGERFNRHLRLSYSFFPNLSKKE